MPAGTISQLSPSTDMLFLNRITASVRPAVFFLCAILAQGCNDRSVEAFSEVTVSITVPQDIATDMLRAFVYDSESGDLRGQIFISNKEINGNGTTTFRSKENLRRGTYDIIVYNFDLPDTFIRGEEKIASLEAYTSEVNASLTGRFGSDITSGEAICNTPDILGVARILNVRIAEGTAISGELNQVTIQTNLKLGAEGLQWAVTKSAVASGFATSWFLGTGEAGKEGRIWFEMTTKDNENLIASIPSFGKAADKFDFTFNVTTSDGSYNYSTTTDNSFEFDKAIVIPEPQNQGNNGGSGFVPKIGDWNNISVDVPV